MISIKYLLNSSIYGNFMSKLLMLNADRKLHRKRKLYIKFTSFLFEAKTKHF